MRVLNGQVCVCAETLDWFVLCAKPFRNKGGGVVCAGVGNCGIHRHGAALILIMRYGTRGSGAARRGYAASRLR